MKAIDYSYQAEYKVVEMGINRQKAQPILKAAADACKRLGGMALIDEQYAVVDTALYTVRRKK